MPKGCCALPCRVNDEKGKVVAVVKGSDLLASLRKNASGTGSGTWVFPGGLCVLLSHEHGLWHSSGPVCQHVVVIWK